MARISEKHRSTVKILLGDNDPLMRQGLRNALANEGYRDVRAVGRISTLRENIATAVPDLLIIDVDTPDGDAIELVTDIRNSKLGKNPFLPVIFVTWGADPAVIGRTAKSGADIILVKPLSPAQLFSRIESLVSDRRPFVVTNGYIGPDRREKDGRGNIRNFAVPNTLKDKLEGKPVDPAELSAQVDKVMGKMNVSRVQQGAITLAQKVEEVCCALEGEMKIDGAKNALTLIIRTAKNIQAIGTGDITKLCASLISITGPMARNPQDIDAKEIELLRPLSQSILLASKPDLNDPAVMAEISRAVARFAPKRRPGGADGEERRVASGV